MTFRPFLSKRILNLFSLFLLMAMSASQTPIAEAAIGGCRADPVFILSDGTTLDVTVEINTQISEVKTIRYEVHGPQGVSLIKSISTPTLGFKGKEVIVYYADARPNQYWTDTWVETTSNNIGVTAYTTFVGFSYWGYVALSAQYHPVSGFNAQHLIANLTK